MRFTTRWYGGTPCLRFFCRESEEIQWIRISEKERVFFFAKHHWFFLRKKVALFSKLQRQLLATKCLDHLEWMNNPTDKMPNKPSGGFFLVLGKCKPGIFKLKTYESIMFEHP